MKQDRIIFDNRSSKPLYESYKKAFDFYFQCWSEEYKTQAATCGDFKFFMITNKKSITIQIYDND